LGCHEYFPKLSNDGRWLIWVASAGGHEHDRADYAIFVWQPGTPIEQVARLTHDEGNDQWPDIFVRR
jgi:Tol biopolymer transport system component